MDPNNNYAQYSKKNKNHHKHNQNRNQQKPVDNITNEVEKKDVPKQGPIAARIENCNFLNLRTSPKIALNNVSSILDKEVPLLIKRKVNDQWLEVVLKDGRSGFVMSDFVVEV